MSQNENFLSEINDLRHGLNALDRGLNYIKSSLKEISKARAEANPHFFLSLMRNKRALFIGEGDFSFSLCLAKKAKQSPCYIWSSDRTLESQLSDSAKSNISDLKALNVEVILGLDAQKLEKEFIAKSLDNLIFQFPHTGSREPIGGRNPNFVLIKNVLKSAKYALKDNGQIVITVVDTPHYLGAFQLEDAAKLTGFEIKQIMSFDPKAFEGYVHTNTKSAINAHSTFKTYVFKKA